MTRRFCFFLLWVIALYGVAPPMHALAAVTQVRIDSPRPAGWMLADVVPVTVHIDSPNATLQRSSLPQPGQLNYWLDLRSVDVVQHGSGPDTRYTLTFNYQTFYVPLDVNRRETPALALLFNDGSLTETVNIAGQAFYMSPLRGVAQFGTDISEQIRPDAPAKQIDPRSLWVALGACALLIVFLLSGLAAHYCRWPFHSRRTRPFARAHRAIGRHLNASDAQSYERSLLELHRALDSCNKARLLSSDVAAFVARHPQLQPVQDEINLFFMASARTFFGNDHGQAAPGLNRVQLLHIAGRLAAAERKGR